MKRDSAAVRVGASENGWSASSTELVGMGTPINNNHVLQIRSLHYWEVPRGERLVVGTSKTNLTKTNLPLPTHPHEAKESAHREMDQRRLSESINMPRVLLHLDAKAAPVTVSSRPPAATFAKPKKFVCANCETSIASSWRRSATHGPDQWLCNSCSVYYRMKGVQRPKDLRRDVVDKRLPTGASYKKVPMKRKRADPTDDGLTFRPGGAIAREAKRIAVERQHHQHGYEDYRAFLVRLNLTLSPEVDREFAIAAKQYIATQLQAQNSIHHGTFTSSNSVSHLPQQTQDTCETPALESATSPEPSMRVPEMAPSAESDPDERGSAPLSAGSMLFGGLPDIRCSSATGPVAVTGPVLETCKVPDAMLLGYTLWAFDELEKLGVDLRVW